MNYKTELAKLKLFNEKADKLLRCNFTESLKGSGCKFFRKKEGIPEIERKGPDEEEIDAFILTYRFFIQDRDRISLRTMKETYDELPISHENKKAFYTMRDQFNDFLDSPSIVGIGKEPLTYRSIQETIIYGELAHTNNEKKKIFDQWMGLPFNMMDLIMNEFVYSLAQIEKGILSIRDLNNQVINELQKY